jgi:hypothetical protein
VIDVRETVNGPPWWDDFLGRVRRNGGLIRDALTEMDMHPQIHQPHVSKSQNLRDQLDEAVEAGKQSHRVGRAKRILKAYAAGMTLTEAAATEDLHVAQVYVLLENTGLRGEYEKLRDSSNSQKRDYRSGVAFLRRELDRDRHECGDVVALSYIRTVRNVVDVLDRDSAQLRELGVNGLRNAVLRELGVIFADEDDFPKFLNKDKG